MSETVIAAFKALSTRQSDTVHPDEMLVREVASQYTVNTVAASSTAQTIPDPAVTKINIITLTGNCAFTFPAPAAGLSFILVLNQDATGSRTCTWPASVRWAGGSAPTLTTTANKRDVIRFFAIDGTNWMDASIVKNY